MDKLGPAYLMARERAAERVNTLRMGLMLVFMEVVVDCIIRHRDYYRKYCVASAIAHYSFQQESDDECCFKLRNSDSVNHRSPELGVSDIILIPVALRHDRGDGSAVSLPKIIL